MSIFDICVFRHYGTSEVILILYLNEATEVALFTSFGMSIQEHISKGDKELENDELIFPCIFTVTMARNV